MVLFFLQKVLSLLSLLRSRKLNNGRSEELYIKEITKAAELQ